MVKVMFICHGNICRSPMAQSYFQNLVNEKGLADSFQVESAAARRDEIGNPAHHGSVGQLKEMGVPLVPHRATLLKKEDYDYFDYLIGMDDANIADMKRICGGDKDGKIYKMLDFAGIKRDVADPWFTGDFDATWNDVSLGCNALLELAIKNANKED